MNEMIENGVKLIVVDAMSVTDIEQVVLAMEKARIKSCRAVLLAVHRF